MHPAARAAARRPRAADAARRRAAGGGSGARNAPRGTDLLLRELATGARDLNVGNVSEFSFRKDGRLLALAIDAQDKAGNGLQLRDMTTGAVTPLDSAAATLRADHLERQGRRARGA